MTQTEALKLALEALTSGDGWRQSEAIKAIERALAQPEQEPVAWVGEISEEAELMLEKPKFQAVPLYTTPPQRTWVGLTDEEIADCAEKMEASDPTDSFWREFFRGIEAKLKEKNT